MVVMDEMHRFHVSPFLFSLCSTGIPVDPPFFLFPCVLSFFLVNINRYAGFIGLLSGSQGGAFSITVNTRYDGSFYDGLIGWFLGHNDDCQFLTFQTRLVMEANSTYADAVDSLLNYKPLGPAYIIIGGVKPGEGAVIAKEFNATAEEHGDPMRNHDVWFLNESLAKGSYYVAETNYDRQKVMLGLDIRTCMRYGLSVCGSVYLSVAYMFWFLYDVGSTWLVRLSDCETLGMIGATCMYAKSNCVCLDPELLLWCCLLLIAVTVFVGPTVIRRPPVPDGELLGQFGRCQHQCSQHLEGAQQQPNSECTVHLFHRHVCRTKPLRGLQPTLRSWSQVRTILKIQIRSIDRYPTKAEIHSCVLVGWCVRACVRVCVTSFLSLTSKLVGFQFVLDSC